MLEWIFNYSDMIIFVGLIAIVFVCIHIQYLMAEEESRGESQWK